MGSTDSFDLPAADSPRLVLTHPTGAEMRIIWTQTHPNWGGALTLDDYIKREIHMTKAPLAENGGISRWLLTDGSLEPDQRPILSSCESIRKYAVASAPGSSELEDGLTHGIGSVFTEPQFRGRGYAGRMMTELGKRLEKHSVQGAAKCKERTLFSVLWSDIGKTFYANRGWAVFDSTHLAFPPVKSTTSSTSAANGSGTGLKLLGSDDLPELCAADERLLRSELKRRTADAGRPHVAILPRVDQMRWHHTREAYMTKTILGRTPEIRGAIVGEPGRRMWAIWTRAYYGRLDDEKAGNTLYILRFVVEDDSVPEEELSRGFREIIQVAQAEAAEWRMKEVLMWNPGRALRRAADMSGVGFDFADRDKDSIASLMWYGEGETRALDWVANEKYPWC